MTSFSGSRRRLFVWLLISLLSACGGGDDGVVGTGLTDPPTGGPPGDTIRISGAAEKGPFVKGSEVLVSRLAADGVPSTDTTLSEIQDDLGTFMFAVKQPGPVLIAADGYHFNEITGALSQGRLLLRAVYNASANAEQKAYVNVLTHLAYKRTLVLMAQGMSVDAALKQAELDVLQALRSVLPVTEVTDFTQLSIYDLDTSRATGNGYVLALSATVYQLAMKKEQEQKSSVDAELTALLNGISDDISDDGSIADEAMLTALTNSTRQLRPDLIRANLEERSVSARPEKLLVANMDLFIDTDGDGVVNAQDDDDDNDGMLDVEDASPYVYSEAPVLVPNAATSGVASNTPFTLEWATSDYAKQIEVQLAKDEALTSIVLTELATTNQYTFSLAAGVYYVRARAQNDLGGWGSWSAMTELPVGTFAKSYVSLSARDYATDIMETSDAGFLVVGLSYPTPDRPFDKTSGFMMRLDAMGAIRWRKTVAGTDNTLVGSPVQLSDGSFLVAVAERVTSNPFSHTLRILKTNADGGELWRSAPIAWGSNAAAYKAAHYVIEDDGIVVGMTAALADVIVDGFGPRPNNTPMLFKLDSLGNALWSYQFDGSANVYHSLTGLWKAADGGYAIVGDELKPPQGGLSQGFGPFFASLSADRQQLTVIRTPESLVMDGYFALRASDGGYILAGSPVPQPQAMEWRRYTSGGGLVLGGAMALGCDCYVWFYQLQVKDSEILFGGDGEWDGDDNPSDKEARGLVIISVADSDGALLNRRFFKNDAFSAPVGLRNFIATSDGGFAIYGTVYDNDTGDDKGFVLIKTDPAGNAITAVTPALPPP